MIRSSRCGTVRLPSAHLAIMLTQGRKRSAIEARFVLLKCPVKFHLRTPGASAVCIICLNFAVKIFVEPWRLLDGCVANNYPPIEVVLVNRGLDWNVDPKHIPSRWSTLGFNWVEYVCLMRKLAGGLSISEFVLLPVDEEVELLNDWMCSVNDLMLRNPERRQVCRHHM